jgi:PncC family amidohydrolase
MQDLLPLAETVGARLKARGETIAIAESSTGGLISAALLSVAGASAYFRGGGIIYTVQARQGLLDLPTPLPAPVERAATEPYAELLARTARLRLDADWGLGETGAAGPAGNRYGDAAGHTCIALAGPVARVITIETAADDRVSNMRAFAKAALDLLAEALAESDAERPQGV